MRLIKMTIHAIKMEWYFWLGVKIHKCNHQDYYNKFNYHAEQIKKLSEKSV